jgi:hypothetical protein
MRSRRGNSRAREGSRQATMNATKVDGQNRSPSALRGETDGRQTGETDGAGTAKCESPVVPGVAPQSCVEAEPRVGVSA